MNYKAHHYANVEIGYRPNSHWEKIEYPTKWECEKKVEETRHKYGGGGYVSSETEVIGSPTPDDIRSANTVARMMRNWNGLY